MTKEESTNILRFMTPGGARVSFAGACPYIICNIASSNLFYYGVWIRQIKCIGRVNQNCKFHDPWSKGFHARAWPYKSLYIVNMHHPILDQ